MEYRHITHAYAVSPQIAPEDVAAIKEAGFKSIVCNRPDAEQPEHPASGAIKAAADTAGLTFRYVPVISGQITGENVEAMATALDELPTPVFAYCRSGARSTNLHAMVQQTKG